jgi:hypothetical protein
LSACGAYRKSQKIFVWKVQEGVDEITTIKGRSAEELDPCLEKLRNLRVVSDTRIQTWSPEYYASLFLQYIAILGSLGSGLY